MIAALLVGGVVAGGFVVRCSRWLRPTVRRSVPAEEGGRPFDRHRWRDVATVVFLVVGVAVGVVLVASALLSRVL